MELMESFEMVYFFQIRVMVFDQDLQSTHFLHVPELSVTSLSAGRFAPITAESAS